MKNLFIFMVTFISGTAFASVQDITEFQCTTKKVIEGKVQTKFSFRVENLHKPKGKVNYWTEEGVDEPVTMIPKYSVLGLNDNYVAGKVENGLRLKADGDGCQFTTVVLYEDSGYKIGYASVSDGGCGAKGIPLYTLVNCKVSLLK